MLGQHLLSIRSCSGQIGLVGFESDFGTCPKKYSQYGKQEDVVRTQLFLFQKQQLSMIIKGFKLLGTGIIKDALKSLEVFLWGVCYIFCTSTKITLKTNHTQSVQQQITSTKDPIQLVNPPTLPQIVCRLPQAHYFLEVWVF